MPYKIPSANSSDNLFETFPSKCCFFQGFVSRLLKMGIKLSSLLVSVSSSRSYRRKKKKFNPGHFFLWDTRREYGPVSLTFANVNAMARSFVTVQLNVAPVRFQHLFPRHLTRCPVPDPLVRRGSRALTLIYVT